MTHEPLDPLQAVVHQDPYHYYARLRETPGLAFDPRLKLWVASTAASVAAVLAHPECRVRPASEPVPKAIAGRPAGDIFVQLMRMNDGEAHRCPRQAMQPALSGLKTDEVASRTRAQIDRLDHDLRSPGELSRWILALPVAVIASLLGSSQSRSAGVVADIDVFVACLSPLSTAQQLDASHRAAQRLIQEVQALWSDDATSGDALIRQLRQGASEHGWSDQQAILANLVGLLSQTYEATAGLIGNALVTLFRRPGLQEALHQHPTLVDAMIAEVGRYDPPVHNTRRFVARPLEIDDVALQAGDTILVVLAAANRDPLANQHPDEFILQRNERRTFGFGHARHRCPGHALANTIATTAVQSLLPTLARLPFDRWSWQYRPSVNGRIPVFHLH